MDLDLIYTHRLQFAIVDFDLSSFKVEWKTKNPPDFIVI